MAECVDVLSDFGLPRTWLRVGNRTFKADQDPSLGVLLTAASWVLQRLPGQVVEEQRPELVRKLSQARDLVVEVVVSPAPRVRVRDGQRLLVEIPSGPRPCDGV